MLFALAFAWASAAAAECREKRAKGPPSPFLSRKKNKSTKRERDNVSQEGATEFSRVQKKIFRYSVFGRLLNRNVLYDVGASFRFLLSLDFLKFVHAELSRLFLVVVWTYFCVCVCVCGRLGVVPNNRVCVELGVELINRVCVWMAWCCA